MQGSRFRKGYFGTTDKAVAVSGRDAAGISRDARACNDRNPVFVAADI